MFYKEKEIYPEKGLYGNGNLAITLHLCELVEEKDGMIDASALTVLTVNVDQKVEPGFIWVRDDMDSTNYTVIKDLVKQGYLSYTGLNRPSSFVILKLMKLSDNFFDKEGYIQTIKYKK
jgi:hypothetical protein